MGISDWAAVSGDVIALAALVFSIVSGRQSRAAREAAAASEDRAKSMSASMEKMAAALEKIADSPRRPAAAEPGTSRVEPTAPAEGVTGPDVQFTIEIGDGRIWRLRNVGTERATGVRIGGRPAPPGSIPDFGATLEPFRAIDFDLDAAATDTESVPVDSDQTGPVAVTLPPRRYPDR